MSTKLTVTLSSPYVWDHRHACLGVPSVLLCVVLQKTVGISLLHEAQIMPWTLEP